MSIHGEKQIFVTLLSSRQLWFENDQIKLFSAIIDEAEDKEAAHGGPEAGVRPRAHASSTFYAGSTAH